MKSIIIISVMLLGSCEVYTQSCDLLIDFVKSKTQGGTYTTYNSQLISEVTFYDFLIDSKKHHFAIVCFKRNNTSNTCDEYIYQVASNTILKYSLDHYKNADEAFQEHIQPFNEELGCGQAL